MKWKRHSGADIAGGETAILSRNGCRYYLSVSKSGDKYRAIAANRLGNALVDLRFETHDEAKCACLAAVKAGR